MTGTVLNVGERGLDVEVELGVEGLVPKSALDEEKASQLKKRKSF